MWQKPVSIQNGSKAAQIAEALQQHIDSQALAVGEALGTKATLLERFGVSPGTLNEALRLLQVRDYVIVRPGPKGGIFVGQRRQREGMANVLLSAQEDPQKVNDCLRVQDALHELMVIEAAIGFEPKHAASLNKVMSRLAAATNPREIIALNWALDRAIARVGANRVLTELYCALVDTLEASIKWFDADIELTNEARRVHEDMARAVMAKDVDAAIAAARRHSPDGYCGPAWRLIS